MEAKPIFICYLPVAHLDRDEQLAYLNNVRETLISEIEGWSIILVPSIEKTDVVFATATVNNLTELQQEQLDNLRNDIDRFLKKPVG